MQYVRGRTLQFHIQRHRQEFTDTFIRRTFVHLMNGLREVHASKLLHLDIKPANIYITMESKPVLLDFGAARQALSQDHQRLRPMYTAGYAAPEQYRNADDLGPWTDIYSVGATLYSCISGTHPQPANEREKDDQLVPLRELVKQNYSAELLDLVHQCLHIDHMQRPQTAFELQKALTQEPAVVLTATEQAQSTFTGRLKQTLNRKIF